MFIAVSTAPRCLLCIEETSTSPFRKLLLIKPPGSTGNTAACGPSSAVRSEETLPFKKLLLVKPPESIGKTGASPSPVVSSVDKVCAAASASQSRKRGRPKKERKIASQPRKRERRKKETKRALQFDTDSDSELPLMFFLQNKSTDQSETTVTGHDKSVCPSATAASSSRTPNAGSGIVETVTSSELPPTLTLHRMPCPPDAASSSRTPNAGSGIVETMTSSESPPTLTLHRMPCPPDTSGHGAGLTDDSHADVPPELSLYVQMSALSANETSKNKVVASETDDTEKKRKIFRRKLSFKQHTENTAVKVSEAALEHSEPVVDDGGHVEKNWSQCDLEWLETDSDIPDMSTSGSMSPHEPAVSEMATSTTGGAVAGSLIHSSCTLDSSPAPASVQQPATSKSLVTFIKLSELLKKVTGYEECGSDRKGKEAECGQLVNAQPGSRKAKQKTGVKVSAASVTAESNSHLSHEQDTTEEQLKKIRESSRSQECTVDKRLRKTQDSSRSQQLKKPQDSSQSQERTVDMLLDLESSDKHASDVVAERTDAGHLVKKQPVSQKIKQKTRSTRDLAETVKCDSVLSGVATERKERKKQTGSKSRDHAARKMPDINKTKDLRSKPARKKSDGKDLATSTVKKTCTASVARSLSSDEVAANRCSAIKAQSVGISHTSRSSRLKKVLTIPRRTTVLPEESQQPQVKRSTILGTRVQGTSDVLTKMTDDVALASKRVDKDAKKQMLEPRKTASKQLLVSSGEIQGAGSSLSGLVSISPSQDSSGMKIQSSPKRPTLVQQPQVTTKVSTTSSEVESCSSSTGLAEVSSGAKVSASKIKTSRKVPLDRGLVKTSGKSGVVQGSHSSTTRLAGATSGGDSSNLKISSGSRMPLDHPGASSHSVDVRGSHSLAVGLGGISSGGETFPGSKFQSRSKIPFNARSSQQPKRSIQEVHGSSYAVSSSGLKLQSGYRIPRVSDGSNKTVPGAEEKKSTEVISGVLHSKDRSRHHHKHHERLHSSRSGEIRHHHRHTQSGSSPASRAQCRQNTASTPLKSAAAPATPKPTRKILSLEDYRQRKKQDLDNPEMSAVDSLQSASKATESSEACLKPSLVEQVMMSYAKQPADLSEDPIFDLQPLRGISPPEDDNDGDDDDVMEGLLDLLVDQHTAVRADLKQPQTSTPTSQDLMPFACFVDVLVASDKELVQEANLLTGNDQNIVDDSLVPVSIADGVSSIPETVVFAENVPEEQFEGEGGVEAGSVCAQFKGEGDVEVGSESARAQSKGEGNVQAGSESVGAWPKGEDDVEVGSESACAQSEGEGDVQMGSESARVQSEGEGDVQVGSESARAQSEGEGDVQVGSESARAQSEGEGDVELGPEPVLVSIEGTWDNEELVEVELSEDNDFIFQEFEHDVSETVQILTRNANDLDEVSPGLIQTGSSDADDVDEVSLGSVEIQSKDDTAEHVCTSPDSQPPTSSTVASTRSQVTPLLLLEAAAAGIDDPQLIFIIIIIIIIIIMFTL